MKCFSLPFTVPALPHAHPNFCLTSAGLFPLRCTQTSGSQSWSDLSLWRPCGARGFLFSVFDIARFVLGRRHPGLTVVRLLLRHLFQGFYSRCREALFFRRRRAWATPATRLSGNAETFAVMLHARRKKTVVSSKNVSALVKQAAHGETRTAIIKKKLYEKHSTN